MQSFFVDSRHAASELVREILGTQMDVEQRRLNAAMTGEARDLFDVPPGAGQIGEAQMAKAVRRQRGYPCAQRQPSDDLRPGPLAHRCCAIASGLRQEKGPARTAQTTALSEVGEVEIGAHYRVGYDTLPFGLGRLCAHSKQASCWIDVAGGQRTQFFPAQRTVVCKSKHQTVAHGLAGGCAQQCAPLRIVRNPGQPALHGDQPSLSDTSTANNRTATATGHRIRRPNTLFDQIVVEQPDDGESMTY